MHVSKSIPSSFESAASGSIRSPESEIQSNAIFSFQSSTVLTVNIVVVIAAYKTRQPQELKSQSATKCTATHGKSTEFITGSRSKPTGR